MKIDIVRAWKDETYRSSLSSEEQSMLPAHPAGELELSDADLETILGATGYTNTNALACVQSILVYCISINCSNV